MLNNHVPTDMVLRAAMCEVMNTINNRPLTQLSSDPDDQEALNANQILIGRTNHTQYDYNFDDNELVGRATWKAAHVYADRFWRRWTVEYRSQLLKRTKWFDDRGYYEYCLGDLVMIADQNLPRGSWPRGIISQTYPGPGQKIRTVEVETANSKFKRPVTKIIFIKLKSALSSEDV